MPIRVVFSVPPLNLRKGQALCLPSSTGKGRVEPALVPALAPPKKTAGHASCLPGHPTRTANDSGPPPERRFKVPNRPLATTPVSLTHSRMACVACRTCFCDILLPWRSSALARSDVSRPIRLTVPRRPPFWSSSRRSASSAARSQRRPNAWPSPESESPANLLHDRDRSAVNSFLSIPYWKIP